MTKPICSLSLDLDNQWSYMKTHGDAGWEELPSYLDIMVPRALEMLRRIDWKITFFVVGQDAALDRNREALTAIAEAGHEIGNHSFHHEPWLHLYSKSETRDEIIRAEDAIEGATGHRPTGFRGPGYSLSPATLEVLSERGYHYDATTFPTYIGPLARAYYFRRAGHLTEEQRQERMIMYGTWRHGRQPVSPYYWNLNNGALLEIPVTTMPVIKLPFHFSYLLYIATYSRLLSMLYLRSALWFCRTLGIGPSMLLHPLDFVGSDDIDELGFFPAMNLQSGQKLDLMLNALTILERHHAVLSVGEHADVLRQSTRLAHRAPPGIPPAAGGRAPAQEAVE